MLDLGLGLVLNIEFDMPILDKKTAKFKVRFSQIRMIEIRATRIIQSK